MCNNTKIITTPHLIAACKTRCHPKGIAVATLIAAAKKGLTEYTAPTNSPKDSAPSNTLPQHSEHTANVRYNSTVFQDIFAFDIFLTSLMPNATILQPFGFEKYWQMLFYFVAKGKTTDNGDKCNKKLCNKTLSNIRQTRFEHLQKQNFRKKAKKQNEKR